MAGDPSVLAKLQSLMQQATGEPGEVSAAETVVQPQPQEETVAQPTPTPLPIEPAEPIPVEPASTPPSQEVVEPSPIPEEINEAVEEPEVPADPEEVVNQIVYLVDFCGIEPDEATEVVKSGYGELFKIAASSGIPVSILSEVFLKYIPFVRTSEGEEKFANLTGQRLLDIFSAHLKNTLDEESIIKCLVFAINRPKMSIDDIVSKYLTPKVEKKKKKKVKKKPAVVPTEVPLSIESTNGTILLPGSQGISFSAESVEDSSNIKVTFYLSTPSGKKEEIGSSVVSTSINQDEILYLLAYEMNMVSLGYFEDGISGMAFSARVIFETIRNLAEKEVEIEPSIIGETIDYIIPLEVRTDGEFIILPDTDKVGFSVVKGKKRGMIISFVQRGYPIGSVTVIESVNHAQLSGLLTEAMQLPIESEGAIDFAARLISVIIKTLSRSKEVKFPRPLERREEEVISEDEETSQKLMQYLSLLEED
jgi:hypothetical protein